MARSSASVSLRCRPARPLSLGGLTELSLDELVENRTLSASMARTLRELVTASRSFVVTAIPRLAGKTTLMNAILGERQPGVAARVATGATTELRGMIRAPERGYLVIPEISDAPVPGYLWGAPVRRVFAALDVGFSLATALHSGGTQEAFDVICRGNGVPDEDASRVRYVVYVRSLGDDWRAPTRRVVASIDEILGVRNGTARTLRLHEWDETTDRFDA